MNDLRSRSRGLSAVPDEGSVPTSTPPRDRRETEDQAGRRMSRRQSIAERAKQAAAGEVEGFQEVLPVSDDAMFASSRAVEQKAARAQAQSEAAEAEAAEAEAEAAESGEYEGKTKNKQAKGPSSRPDRRREVAEDGSDEEAEENEDRFPWHFQFDDDEPEELQASSPLLSRAFRATTG